MDTTAIALICGTVVIVAMLAAAVIIDSRK